jgi:hypothetical protein
LNHAHEIPIPNWPMASWAGKRAAIKDGNKNVERTRRTDSNTLCERAMWNDSNKP